MVTVLWRPCAARPQRTGRVAVPPQYFQQTELPNPCALLVSTPTPPPAPSWQALADAQGLAAGREADLSASGGRLLELEARLAETLAGLEATGAQLAASGAEAARLNSELERAQVGGSWAGVRGRDVEVVATGARGARSRTDTVDACALVCLGCGASWHVCTLSPCSNKPLIHTALHHATPPQHAGGAGVGARHAA